MTPGEAAALVVDAMSSGRSIAEVIVVASERHDVPLGTRMVVWSEAHAGTLGDPDMDDAAAQLARAMLLERRAGIRPLASPDGDLSVFVDPHQPPDELIIVGAGHIAIPLSRIGAMLGFRVLVIDDRPGFATRDRFPDAARLVKADFSDPFRGLILGPTTHLVLVTRGHKYDFEALRDILLKGVEVGYIGMVGSQRRVRAAFEQLAREGIPTERLARVHAPIGLDIRAETPEEIAVSITAELVRTRRGGTGEPLSARARVIERWMGKTGNEDRE